MEGEALLTIKASVLKHGLKSEESVQMLRGHPRMKKIAAYTFIAVFLGLAMMLAPFVLFLNEVSMVETVGQTQRAIPFSSRFFREASSKIEKLYGIAPAAYPSEALFIVFMLLLSLLIAFGVRRYFTRKTGFLTRFLFHLI